MFKTIKNALKTPDIRKKLWYTLLLIVLFRLGCYITVPGVDISASIGDTFIAANDGVVAKAEYNTAYGNMVLINHGGGVSTLYAHGSQIMVQVGQEVKRGDEVLKVGSTGYSTGPHAHFEVRINGQYVDPMPYITTKNN